MKLIAVDLDGTLLNHSKEVLESSRQAIAAAAAAGVQVVVASGRSTTFCRRYGLQRARDLRGRRGDSQPHQRRIPAHLVPGLSDRGARPAAGSGVRDGGLRLHGEPDLDGGRRL